MRIKLTYSRSEFVLRQTPNRAGIWDDVMFVDGDQHGEYDAWVVYESVPARLEAVCDPRRTIFIMGEPAEVRRYSARFLAQFACVLGPQSGTSHACSIRGQAAIPWWIGVEIDNQPNKTTSRYVLDYDQLKTQAEIPKIKTLSVICSTKSLTEGHRQRLRFVEQLQTHFGDSMDVFGYGFRPIRDKWHAIAPYKYHIVLENVRADHYWTEKLADALLAWSFPIYCGCPNLSDYFDEGSFLAINRTQPGEAIERIESAIKHDLFTKCAEARIIARARVLDEYNLFPTISRIVKRMPAGAKSRVRLRPEREFAGSLGGRARLKVKELAKSAPWIKGGR